VGTGRDGAEDAAHSIGLLLAFARNVTFRDSNDAAAVVRLGSACRLLVHGSQGPELTVDEGLVEAIGTDEQDVLPQERGEVAPSLLRNSLALGVQPGSGGGEVAGVEDHDRVEHEAEGRGPAELGPEVPVVMAESPRDYAPAAPVLSR
jgi:hypothetical protein